MISCYGDSKEGSNGCGDSKRRERGKKMREKKKGARGKKN
jgi:hypothetical protein